jgi:hypothetical protein
MLVQKHSSNLRKKSNVWVTKVSSEGTRLSKWESFDYPGLIEGTMIIICNSVCDKQEFQWEHAKMMNQGSTVNKFFNVWPIYKYHFLLSIMIHRHLLLVRRRKSIMSVSAQIFIVNAKYVLHYVTFQFHFVVKRSVMKLKTETWILSCHVALIILFVDWCDFHWASGFKGN